jgi:uncharacterized Zn finger protein (UPF0148 family)
VTETSRTKEQKLPQRCPDCGAELQRFTSRLHCPACNKDIALTSNEHVKYLREVIALQNAAMKNPRGISLPRERAEGLLAEIDRMEREEVRLATRLQESREANRKIAEIRTDETRRCTHPSGSHSLAKDSMGKDYCTWCDWPTVKVAQHAITCPCHPYQEKAAVRDCSCGAVKARDELRALYNATVDDLNKEQEI